MGEQPAGGATGNVQRPIDDAVKVLSVMIVNKGSYTITRIEARFCTDGNNVISHHQFARLGAFDDLPRRLSEGFTRLEDDSGCGDVLAPGDIGMRFESDRLGAQHIAGPFPLVRWTDRWGTRWEHKRGEVLQVGESDPWVP
jgi:hypothetical protein